MATLEKIRGKAGLLVGAIGVALFAFIIGDFLNSGSTFFRQSAEKIFSVNGEKVSITDFDKRVNEMTEVYQIQFGQQSLPEEYQQQIRQSVFDTFVRETLYGEIFSKTGISVSPEELFDMIQGKNISPMVEQIPIFRNPQTGAFDRTLLLNFLKTIESTDPSQDANVASQIAQYKRYWLFWENMLQTQKKEEKLNAILATAVVPNKLDAEYTFNQGRNSVDILYASKSYTSIPDSTIQLSNSDLKKAYDAQIERFKQDETRNIGYLVSKINPSSEDFIEIETAINKVKEEFAVGSNYAEIVNENSDAPFGNFYQSAASLDASEKEFAQTAAIGTVKGPFMEDNTYKMYRMVGATTAPDSVRVRQIMIGTGNATRDAFLVDSIRGLITKEPFAEVATKLGTPNGGEIGWLTEEAALNGLNEEFKNKCFSTAPKTVFTVKSNYGTHLVMVEEATRPVKKYKMASLSMAVVPSSKSYSKLYNDINQIISANNSAEKFAKAAAEKGYQVVPAQPISAQEQMLNNIKNSRQAIRWAFGAKKGEVSQIFDCDGNFIVAAVNSITPKGYTPLAEIKEYISYEVRNEKKGEQIVADLKKQNPTSLSAYAQAMGSTRLDTAKFMSMASSRVAGLGNEPALIAQASMAQEGAVSAPVIGKNGVYVFTVIKKNADQAKFDVNVEKQTLSNNLMYRLMYQNFEVLRRKADIVDNRVKFF